jgi:hypothetical protein
MKSRTLLLSVFALAACAADPDPDRADGSGRGGASESGGASGSGGEHASGDASVDALLHEPDVDPRPNCVAPVDGECPDDIEDVLYGSIWNPQEGCWRRNEIISCLYNVGRSPGSAEYCREADGAPFTVPEITCIPIPGRICTSAELEATTPVTCPDE